MSDFFYWSGVVAWMALAIVGVGTLFDWAVERLIENLWTKKQFLAFVADRLRNR